MKKNIIFVMNTMVSGGAERSLLTLLKKIDYDEYNVDLFLFKHKGLFFDRIPLDVNVLESSEILSSFEKPTLESIIALIFKYPKAAFWRIIAMFYVLVSTMLNKYKPNKIWIFKKNVISSFEKEYDCAIGYLQGKSIYMVVDKIKAKQKVGYIHTDYSKIDHDIEFDKYYLDRLDKIAVVSEASKHTLVQVFPNYLDKVDVIHNILPEEDIRKLAAATDNPYYDNSSMKILTIGRLSEVKGYDLAIKALKILRNEGYEVKWYAIGTGQEKRKIEEMIQKYQLEDLFVLLGEKANPYPYIKYADLYVQTSLFEGWGIAIQEALILNKVVVSTNFPCVHEQIHSEINGIICNMTPDSIAEGIKKVLNNPKLQEKILENLVSRRVDSADIEMEKFYRFIKAEEI